MAHKACELQDFGISLSESAVTPTRRARPGFVVTVVFCDYMFQAGEVYHHHSLNKDRCHTGSSALSARYQGLAMLTSIVSDRVRSCYGLPGGSAARRSRISSSRCVLRATVPLVCTELPEPTMTHQVECGLPAVDVPSPAKIATGRHRPLLPSPSLAARQPWFG